MKAGAESLGRVNPCCQRIWSNTLACAVSGRKGGSTWCNEQELSTGGAITGGEDKTNVSLPDAFDPWKQ